MNNNNENKNPSFFSKLVGGLKKLGSTLVRWAKRAIFPGKELDVMAVENLESPTKLAVKVFFRRKLAVGALVLLIALFLFVFIGSALIPMDVTYTDSNLANLAPNLSMLSVPDGLKDNVKEISSFSNYTVGVSRDNKLYVWGITKDSLTGVDLGAIPEELLGNNVYTASAGYDHAIAITTDGKIIGWGNKNRGQYGPYSETAAGNGVVFMPEELSGNLDVTKISSLVCGYQATVLIYDGKVYAWGNGNALTNLEKLSSGPKAYQNGEITPVKAVLGNYYGMVLYSDGSFHAPLIFDRNTMLFDKDGVSHAQRDLGAIKEIAATKDNFALLSEDGTLYIQGPDNYGERSFNIIPENETIVKLVGGTRHFIALTDAGRAYSWGHNDEGQANIHGDEASDIFAGSKQSYLVNEEGSVTKSVGLRGYVFGTDKLGRDVFTRIIHGGKMTMTVGAVAVIVSTIIAIIVGCLSGYFGGWVDMLLMRVTEIFSAIPFLPFAMMLSYVIQKNPIEETTRIIIIMIMLGLLSWTGLARMIRGQVLAEREKEFVIAAKSMGVKESRIAFKHILPNVISVILVSVTLDFAGCLLTESSLSYLGFGVQQPQPTWGNMLNGANNSIVIQNYWWQWVFPSIFLALATISINIIGDTLRDVLDPKSSREK